MYNSVRDRLFQDEHNHGEDGPKYSRAELRALLALHAPEQQSPGTGLEDAFLQSCNDLVSWTYFSTILKLLEVCKNFSWGDTFLDLDKVIFFLYTKANHLEVTIWEIYCIYFFQSS